ncbi:hypothetical protein HQ43_07655 [Porphyromonas canoris]|uniref:Uncharacterized protein n=1 Tax=Porphyromonas canoris TaxID=36875 RepID=A0ABR4XJR0_9PORP|nr:hypothetical protein HQ43_07655 [Porphyromonas canoris]
MKKREERVWQKNRENKLCLLPQRNQTILFPAARALFGAYSALFQNLLIYIGMASGASLSSLNRKRQALQRS